MNAFTEHEYTTYPRRFNGYKWYKPLLVGLLFGTAVLCFGFWQTFFVICCGLIGLFIGLQLDNGEDAVENMRERAWRLLERFQR